MSFDNIGAHKKVVLLEYPPAPTAITTNNHPPPLTNMIFRAAVLVALAATAAYGACPPVPDGACNVCGEGKCVSKPDAIFSLPPNPSVACGDLQQAGFNGDEQVAQNCAVLGLLIGACGCDAVGAPDTPAPVVAPTPAPTSAPTLPPAVPETPTAVVPTAPVPVIAPAPTTSAPVTAAPTTAPVIVFTPAPAKPTKVPATSGKKPKGAKGAPTTKKGGKMRALRVTAETPRGN
jgi:hypothetical protein